MRQTMEFDLKRTLLALLHSTGEPLSVKDVQAVITRYHEQNDRLQEEAVESGEEATVADMDGQGLMRDLLDQVPSLLTSAQIRDAMDELSQDLREADAVFRIQEGPSGYRIVISPQYGEWVRLLRNEPRPQRLSAAALETLAIVAYRQPVTRSDMEAIRGVSADSALNKLLERDLVQVIGRAELPGRPLQYGTTDTFLEFCGLRSLEELPASDVLSPNQITEWIRAASLPEEELSDKDVGLAEEPGTASGDEAAQTGQDAESAEVEDWEDFEEGWENETPEDR